MSEGRENTEGEYQWTNVVGNDNRTTEKVTTSRTSSGNLRTVVSVSTSLFRV